MLEEKEATDNFLMECLLFKKLPLSDHVLLLDIFAIVGETTCIPEVRKKKKTNQEMRNDEAVGQRGGRRSRDVVPQIKLPIPPSKISMPIL